jgi:hypothetical protein
MEEVLGRPPRRSPELPVALACLPGQREGCVAREEVRIDV